MEDKDKERDRLRIALADDNLQRWANRAINLRETRLRRVVEIIAEEPPARLLDVGCGAGEFSGPLVADGWQVFGAELILSQARHACDRGVRAAVCEISSGLPFRSAEFDLVFAGEIIEHLIDTDGFLSELNRVLKPRGVLVITTPNLASLENRLRLFFGFYPQWVDYSLGSSGHVRAYTPRVLRAQLAAHGFSVERHVGNWIPFIPQNFADDVRNPWLSMTGGWWPNLAMAIIMKCRKILR